MTSIWQPVLELDSQRRTVSGSALTLTNAIRRGADLRIGTAFRHNEHIDTQSSNDEWIREQMDFRVTYLLDERWVAGIETLRMPVSLPREFGPRPSMSFFLYNQDGHQAVARPFLDGASAAQVANVLAPKNDPAMPRMHLLDSADDQTNAPSHSFIYDFEYFRYFVCARWREVYSHDEQGKAIAGDYSDLIAAIDAGAEVKIAVRNLGLDAGSAECQGDSESMTHEVFVHVGPSYQYTKSGFLVAATNPVVRVRPSIPLQYRSLCWDFAWLLASTDGHVARWIGDPYTLQFKKSSTRYAMRWFVDAAP